MARKEKMPEKIPWGSMLRCWRHPLRCCLKPFSPKSMKSLSMCRWLLSGFAVTNSSLSELRVFFATMRESVAKKYPNSQLKAVGSFYFLRFVCPFVSAGLHNNNGTGFFALCVWLSC